MSALNVRAVLCLRMAALASSEPRLDSRTDPGVLGGPSSVDRSPVAVVIRYDELCSTDHIASSRPPNGAETAVSTVLRDDVTGLSSSAASDVATPAPPREEEAVVGLASAAPPPSPSFCSRADHACRYDVPGASHGRRHDSTTRLRCGDVSGPNS